MEKNVDETFFASPNVYEQVYYVDRVNSARLFNPIAIRPMIYLNRISWDDTTPHGLTLTFTHIKIIPTTSEGDSPETILIISDDGDQIALRKLTLSLFNAKVKDSVAEIPFQFNTDEQLRQFYLHPKM